MQKFNWLLAISMLFLVVAACQPAAPQEPETGPAVIKDIKVNFVDMEPPVVMAVITCPMPYICTVVDELKTERSDENVINITLTITSTPGRNCPKTEAFLIVQNVDLGSDFVSGQTYTINVNDKTTTFVME